MMSFWFEGLRLYLFLDFYDNGRFAINLYDHDNFDPFEEAPYHILTVNLPDFPLEPNEFCVKTWREGEDVARAALASGLFMDTGRRVATGFVEAQVWRFQRKSSPPVAPI